MAAAGQHHLGARPFLAGFPQGAALVMTGTDAAATPAFMTVVLPALNEERYLARCVRSLLDDPYPRDRLELVIVDGGSRDRTLEVARELRGEFPFLRILYNPRRLQSAGFNLALRAADP